MKDVNGNCERIEGEVVGYRVDMLPLKVEEYVNERTGKVNGTRTRNPKLIGVLTIRLEEDGQMKSLPINCHEFSEDLDPDANWEATKATRAKLFKQMMKAAPYGATVPLKKKAGKGKDRPFYLLEVEQPKQ